MVPEVELVQSFAVWEVCPACSGILFGRQRHIPGFGVYILLFFFHNGNNFCQRVDFPVR